MYRAIADFEESWKYEAGKTGEILAALNDASLNKAVMDGHRTLGRMAWHLVTTIPEMASRTGLKLAGPQHTDPIPKTLKGIQEGYKQVADSLIAEIKKQWDDQALLKEDDMYGEMWKRGATLGALVAHQTHHRGQMTVVMRQAGLKVPGVYGPAKEEWSNYGAQPPEI